MQIQPSSKNSSKVFRGDRDQSGAICSSVIVTLLRVLFEKELCPYMNEMNKLVLQIFVHYILKISEIWNKGMLFNYFKLEKFCDHCREQIRSDKHFPTFWASWVETLTFQIVWFWNKTWLYIITFWCSWKIQIFRKSSKWYALLKNWIIGNLVYVKTYHTQNPFQVLDHDYTRLPFSFLIDI